ncbi:MAG TPA: hypothetical protein VMV03_01375 [Spirochaetia bacterium]|nr:hypothetical protein [Spirochaetia bacterium]
MIELQRRLSEIYRAGGPPEAGPYAGLLAETLSVLGREPAAIRPPDAEGRPGGVVSLDPQLPTIVVPDIHARMDFFLAVLAHEAEDGGRVIELLESGRIQVVCLGDGVHAEGRASRRWHAALEEFQDGFRSHESMDEEMRESLGVMAMVMEAKRSFPALFHFLKGNHENIENESGHGNRPFRKYALEGLMVLSYMLQFYGDGLLADYARFEKELPLLAVGNGFLLSHAEPAHFFARERVIGYRDDPEVVTGLTWTDNNEAEPDSVARMLAGYLDEEAAARAYYFGGHRPAIGKYRLRAQGRYVQIHDPDRFVIAHLPAGGGIELDRDVREIDGDAGRELA